MPWLHWLTRDEDIKKAKVAPYRLLEAMPSLTGNPGFHFVNDELENGCYPNSNL